MILEVRLKGFGQDGDTKRSVPCFSGGQWGRWGGSRSQSHSLTHALFEGHIERSKAKEPIVVILVFSRVDTVLIERVFYERHCLRTTKRQFTKRRRRIVHKLGRQVCPIRQLC